MSGTTFDEWAMEHAARRTPVDAAGMLETISGRLEFSAALASFLPVGFSNVLVSYFGALEPEEGLATMIGCQLEASEKSGSDEIWIADLGAETNGDFVSAVQSVWSIPCGELRAFLGTAAVEDLFAAEGDGFVEVVRPWLLDTPADQPPRRQSVAADPSGAWLIVNGIDAGFQAAGLLAFRDDVAGAFEPVRSVLRSHRDQWVDDSTGWRLDENDPGEREFHAERSARRDALLASLAG